MKQTCVVMGRKYWLFLMVVVVSAHGINATTLQQLKKTLQTFRKYCLTKIDVTEDMIEGLEIGKFIEDKNVMCYTACVYQIGQVLKNNKLSYEAFMKQIDLLYPEEMKDDVKKTIDDCRDVQKKYTDQCEMSYWTAKCIYESDPKNFVFA